ncbi:MAG: glycoside hydrolase family 3 protein, partial [Gammaproteobacteria bacterium]|nr:glycoside hydrolase family 3 protein [Gammaproteobacteria bacterium]
AEACGSSVNAGVDLLMVGVEWRAAYHDLLQQVSAGAVPMARIDDAVRRILRVKARAGLVSCARSSARPATVEESVVGEPSHRELARRAVRRSLVLLKNDGVLPLKRDAKVLVAGDGADNIGKQCGGWTLTWQGTGNDNSDFPNGMSLFDGFVEATAHHGGSAILSPNGEFGGDSPDVAVVVFGEEPYAEGDGDRDHLSYSTLHAEPLAILRRLQERGIPTVSVFLTGRPMWVNPELNASDAFVVAWLPGTEGGGVADVLFRGPNGKLDHDFHGRLSFSWPRHAMHTPLNVGDTDYAPLFPYGYGLRYGDAIDRPGRLDETDSARGMPARDRPCTMGSTYPR